MPAAKRFHLSHAAFKFMDGFPNALFESEKKQHVLAATREKHNKWQQN